MKLEALLSGARRRMQGDGLKRMPRAVPERANGDGLAGQQARLLPDFRPGSLRLRQRRRGCGCPGIEGGHAESEDDAVRLRSPAGNRDLLRGVRLIRKSIVPMEIFDVMSGTESPMKTMHRCWMWPSPCSGLRRRRRSPICRRLRFRRRLRAAEAIQTFMKKAVLSRTA